MDWIMNEIQIIIPKFESHFILSKARRAKYRTKKDGSRYVSNPKYAGKPRLWRVNGQDLYSGVLHPQQRSKITKYYHEYLTKFIPKKLKLKEFPISTRVEIHEVKQDVLPDASNLWIWLKWFEDVLTESEVIPDDGPNYVISSGPAKYVWVEREEQRKLVFIINY